MKNLLLPVLLAIALSACQPVKRVGFWEDYTDVFDADGRVENYQIEKGKYFVIQYLTLDNLRDVLYHTPEGKFDKIIEENPAWEFVFYCECPVSDSLKLMNLLERYHCRFPVILDPEGQWPVQNLGCRPHSYLAGGVICDERGKVLGGSVIGTTQSFFDSEFIRANRELGWRNMKKKRKTPVKPG